MNASSLFSAGTTAQGLRIVAYDSETCMAPKCMINGKVGLAGSFIRKGFSSSVKGTKDT